MNLNISLDDEKLKSELAAQYRSAFLNKAAGLIQSSMSDGKTGSHPAGIGYTLIKQYVEDELVKINSPKIIGAYIEQNWARILTEATERALIHKANAIAFASTK